jgi:branched-chain amino acid transport system permease protein
MRLVSAIAGGVRRQGWIRVAIPMALLAALAAMPWIGVESNLLRLLFITFIWTTTGIAWNILGGFAGQVSFGFAVFYGLGAYTAAILINSGSNPYLCFLGSALVASLASLIIGLPTFRLRGPYFAIATIGVSETVRVIMTNLSVTGGASGYRIVEATAFRQAEHFYSGLLAVALAFLVSVLILRSRFGLALVAIRDDEPAASDVGINPLTHKLAAHAVAAALTGVAGGVFARYAAFIHPQGVFAFNTSVYIVLIPVIGGIGTLWGPVLGGAIFGIVEEELVVSFPEAHLLLYGALLILIVLLEPGGLIGILRKGLRHPRLRFTS